MTPYQARHLYFCRRNPETGQPVIDYAETEETEKVWDEEALFREYWRLNGLQKYQVDKLWRERGE